MKVGAVAVIVLFLLGFTAAGEIAQGKACYQSAFGARDCTYALDSDNSSQAWHTSTAGSTWENMTVDLNNTYNVTNIEIMHHLAGTVWYEDLQVWYSSDNFTTQTLAGSISGNGQNNRTFNFTNGIQARYWRLVVHSPQGDGVHGYIEWLGIYDSGTGGIGGEPNASQAFYVLTESHPLLPNGTLTSNLTAQLVVNKLVDEAFKVLSSAAAGYSFLVNPVSNFVNVSGNLIVNGILEGVWWNVDEQGTLYLPRRSGTTTCSNSNGTGSVSFASSMPDSNYSIYLTLSDDAQTNLGAYWTSKTTSGFSYIVRKQNNGAAANCATSSVRLDWIAVDN